MTPRDAIERWRNYQHLLPSEHQKDTYMSELFRDVARAAYRSGHAGGVKNTLDAYFLEEKETT